MKDIIKRQLDISNPRSNLHSWLNKVANNTGLANGISKSLLIDGKSICNNADDEAFRQLLIAIRKSGGMGKGVFSSALCFMGEPFARRQLKEWMLEDCLQNIQEADWEGVMLTSFENQRYHLASDMVRASTMAYGASPSLSVFSNLDEDILTQTEVIWSEFRSDLVDTLCSRSSYLRARLCAGSDPELETRVMRSISQAIGYKGAVSWPRLMKFMLDECKEEITAESAINKFKSSASVVLNEVLSIDEDDADIELPNDELRLMAYTLGLDHVIKKISSPQAKRGAFSHSLGL